MQAILYPGPRVPHIISIYYKLLGYVVHLKFLSSTNIGQIWKSNFNFLQQHYTVHLLLYSVFLKCWQKTISLHDYCLGDSELLGREDFKQGHDRPDEILQYQWGKGTPFM